MNFNCLLNNSPDLYPSLSPKLTKDWAKVDTGQTLCNDTSPIEKYHKLTLTFTVVFSGLFQNT